MEWDVSGECRREGQFDTYPSGSNGTLFTVISGCGRVGDVDDIQKRRVLDALTIDLQYAKVQLMNVESMQLVGPVLDHPLFRGPRLDRDIRPIAHLIGLEHGTRPALHDIEIDLVIRTGPRILRERDAALPVGSSG